MELWIRTKHKTRLLKVNNIAYELIMDDRWAINGSGFQLGVYPNRERCIEIVDEIEELLKSHCLLPLQPNVLVYEMPQN